jgi:hypothetical protein
VRKLSTGQERYEPAANEQDGPGNSWYAESLVDKDSHRDKRPGDTGSDIGDRGDSETIPQNVAGRAEDC